MFCVAFSLIFPLKSGCPINVIEPKQVACEPDRDDKTEGPDNMTKGGTPPRESNTTVAVTRLRSMIFSGTLGAGTDHLESELAARLGMSRTPVREALLRLESQGLVEVRPRKGARITPLSPSDMAEIYDLLTEIEGLAAVKAAERGVSAAELVRMSQAMDDMEDALARNDLEAWAVADDAFHRQLTKVSGSGRLMQIACMLADQVHRARRVTLHLRPTPTKSNDDHAQLLDAIRRGDAEMARSVHRNHRLSAKDLILNILERHRLSSI